MPVVELVRSAGITDAGYSAGEKESLPGCKRTQ
jgi:hypothetical protein